MPTTTNYGWTTPADTDLVKDGAAAIRTLGSSIDTTVFNNANAAIAKTIVDAKGDIIAATAADTVTRLAVGSNDQVLTADSSTATGLKWATPAGAKNFSLVNAGGTALTGATTITISSISNADDLYILVEEASTTNNGSTILIRINGDTGTNYYSYGNLINPGYYYYGGDYTKFYENASSISLARLPNGNSTQTVTGYIRISGGNTSGMKMFHLSGGASSPSDMNTQYQRLYNLGGYYNSSSTISSVSIVSSSGNFDNGTVYVYKSS